MKPSLVSNSPTTTNGTASNEPTSSKASSNTAATTLMDTRMDIAAVQERILFHDLDLCLDHISVPVEIQCTPAIRHTILENEGLSREEDESYASKVKAYLSNLVEQNVTIILLTNNSTFNALYFLRHVVALDGKYLAAVQVLSTAMADHKMEKSTMLESYLLNCPDLLAADKFFKNSCTKVVYVDDSSKEIAEMEGSANHCTAIIPSFRAPPTGFGKRRTYAESKRDLQQVPGIMNQPGVLEQIRVALDVERILCKRL